MGCFVAAFGAVVRSNSMRLLGFCSSGDGNSEIKRARRTQEGVASTRARIGLAMGVVVVDSRVAFVVLDAKV
jgi:hypothetical protein